MISVDDPETNKRFAEETGADFVILSDPGKEVARAYGVLSERGTANRWTFYIGEDGTILGVDREVKAAEAGQGVVAKLGELGVEKSQ